MVIKFKKLDKEATAPSRANPTDAGWDLTAMYIELGEKFEDPITYRTGIAVAIPEGYVGLLFPRSSIYKKDLLLANSVGVIDPGYRGEIIFKFRRTIERGIAYTPGERIGQLVVIPIGDIFFDETWELPPSDGRGEGGFGSSDLLSRLS